MYKLATGYLDNGEIIVFFSFFYFPNMCLQCVCMCDGVGDGRQAVEDPSLACIPWGPHLLCTLAFTGAGLADS